MNRIELKLKCMLRDSFEPDAGDDGERWFILVEGIRKLIKDLEEGQDGSLRGTGRTKKQIEDAQQGSIFVWCNNRIDYPKQLAKSIGRSDVRIEGKSWLCSERIRGIDPFKIIVDHAFFHARVMHEQYEGFRFLQHRRSVHKQQECQCQLEVVKTEGEVK